MEKISLLRNYRLIIIITLCIVGIGILLRILPSRFMLAKPLYLLELDLQDLRTEWRTGFYNLFHPPVKTTGYDTTDSSIRESPISLILIHEREFVQYGFPPNRAKIADVVNALTEHGAEVIAFDMTFELKRSKEETERLAKASLEANNVIYPITVTDAKDISLMDENLRIPPALETYLRLRSKGDSPKDEMAPARLPEEPLLSSASALGHIRAPFDMDGKIRRVPLVIKGSDGLLYPSLSLMAVCLFREIPPAGITIEWGKRIILDNQKKGKSHWRGEIPIDQKGQIRINYAKRLRYFPNRYAFSDVHRAWRSIPGLDKPQIQLEYFRGKAVLIGYLEEKSEQTSTPLELEFPGVAVHATIVENILQKSFVRDAGWGLDALVLFFFTALMVVSQVYPYRFSSRRPQITYKRLTAIALGIFLGFIIINFIVFCVGGIFLNLALPLMTMLLAYFTAMGYRYVTTTETFIRKLEHEKAYNDLILENMGNGLIVLDNRGKITTLNQKAAQFFNLNEKQVLGKHVKERFGKEFPQMADELTKALDLEAEKANRFPLTIEGHELEVSLAYGSKALDNRCRVIAVITDVTEIRDLERKIQLQQRQAAYSQLASELNHRIKNYLQIIKLDTDKLTRRIESNESNKALNLIERITRQVDDLEKLATDFKRGISTYNLIQDEPWSEVNLNEVVNPVLETVSQSINESIQIQTKLCEHLPLLRIKPKWFREALQNLVNNSIDAMRQGGKLTIATEILPNDKVMLTVSDTGEGISDEDKPKIFTPWFTRKEEGSGIGLYTVQQVMMVHNGEVEFESQEGKGTEFRLLFPTTVFSEGEE